MRARTLVGPPSPSPINVDSLFVPPPPPVFQQPHPCASRRMQSGGAAPVSDRWQTPSRVVFPHQLLNYSGQGFLWGDPGSSRQTDAAGPAGDLAGKLGIIAKKFLAAPACVARGRSQNGSVYGQHYKQAWGRPR